MIRYPLLLCAALIVSACESEAPVEPVQSVQSTDAVQVVEPAPDALPTDGPNSQPGTTATASVLCTGKEEEIFYCKVESGKRIAVCAANDGKVQYRFGSDSPEIELEASQWSSVGYSGGGEAQIAFDNTNTRYVVFSRIVRTNFKAGEPNNPAVSDGVIVTRGDQVLGLQTCIGPDIGSINVNALEGLLPRSDELFTYETERADNQ